MKVFLFAEVPQNQRGTGHTQCYGYYGIVGLVRAVQVSHRVECLPELFERRLLGWRPPIFQGVGDPLNGVSISKKCVALSWIGLLRCEAAGEPAAKRWERIEAKKFHGKVICMGLDKEWWMSNVCFYVVTWEPFPFSLAA